MSRYRGYSRGHQNPNTAFPSYGDHIGIQAYNNEAFDVSSFQNDDFGGNEFSNFSYSDASTRSHRGGNPGLKRPHSFGQPAQLPFPAHQRNSYPSPYPWPAHQRPTYQHGQPHHNQLQQPPHWQFQSDTVGEGGDRAYNSDGYGFEGVEETLAPPSKRHMRSGRQSQPLMSDPIGFYGAGPQFQSEPQPLLSAISGKYVIGPSGYGRPVYTQHRPDTISPYYGIEELRVEEEEEESESFDQSGSTAMDSSFPFGKWQSATEDEEDIGCLTRDAQIIAGQKPEPPPVSMETAQKAMEIEITVPSELMQPDLCQLCQAQFSSPQMAESHYLGKKHAQRENQYVRKIYEEKGINVTRFLTKPEYKVAQQEKKKSSVVKKRFKFSCNLCNLGFEAQDQVDLHVVGALHRKKVFEAQAVMISSRLRFQNPASEQVGEFYCRVCDKVANSEQQFEIHIQSRKHKNKAAESGI